jgi:glutaredoxin-like YruB-family protein
MKEQIQLKQITLYSQPDCPPCEISKLFLQEYGFAYESKDISKDKKARNELTKRYNSYSTPTFVIGQTVITGFDLEKLKAELNID